MPEQQIHVFQSNVTTIIPCITGKKRELPVLSCTPSSVVPVSTDPLYTVDGVIGNILMQPCPCKSHYNVISNSFWLLAYPPLYSFCLLCIPGHLKYLELYRSILADESACFRVSWAWCRCSINSNEVQVRILDSTMKTSPELLPTAHHFLWT